MHVISEVSWQRNIARRANGVPELTPCSVGTITADKMPVPAFFSRSCRSLKRCLDITMYLKSFRYWYALISSFYRDRIPTTTTEAFGSFCMPTTDDCSVALLSRTTQMTVLVFAAFGCCCCGLWATHPWFHFVLEQACSRLFCVSPFLRSFFCQAPTSGHMSLVH